MIPGANVIAGNAGRIWSKGGPMSAEAQAKLDALKALDDGALLEKAWHELNALCGNVPGERRKEWIMHIPVDAERDSDVIFGEVLMRFGKLIAVPPSPAAARMTFGRTFGTGSSHE